MKTHFKALTTMVAVVALSVLVTPGYAQLTTTSYADQATWNSTSANGFSLVNQTTTTPQATLTVNQGLSGNGALVQTITPTTTFTLGAFSIYLAGAAVNNMSIHIFEITPGFPSSGWAATGGFNPLSNANTNDLLNPGNIGTGQTFNYSGTPTQNYLEFDLGAANQITLTAGTSYDFELWSPNGAATVYWRRSGSDVYANGNEYSASGQAGYGITVGSQLGANRTDVSGSGRRDAGLALYAAPEPASMALLGFGTLVSTFILRRRKH
jgi:hypothetical protein